ncbi:dipeptide ABC transporter ATP-binding protein [Kitasatospora sp. NPDC057223]|uniref:dipeptide ABC transporter ATP-binding protein n=1 Tax=Kitasatospora sp. NPDC057223 TaxID=3346055 RepID=UPI00362C358C
MAVTEDDTATTTVAGQAVGAVAPTAPPVLVAEGLRVGFGRARKGTGSAGVGDKGVRDKGTRDDGVRDDDVVRGISFTLHAGQCLAVVGESGSGKSVTARTLLGLAGSGASVRADRLELDGLDLTTLDDRAWRTVRGRRVGLVLQDALVSLDPLRRIGAEVTEALLNHRLLPAAERAGRAVELLAEAGVPEPEVRARQFPHELSGGQRQRALIASAVAADPAVLVADEPTTALDVTVQARILDLLAQKKAEGAALLLISHDLSVVARLADRIAVMFGGVFVEEGPAEQVLRAPAHPYTRELLAAVPGRHPRGTPLSVRSRELPVVAATTGTAAGCRYAVHCPLAEDRCRAEDPPVVEVSEGRVIRCLRPDEPWPAPVPQAAATGGESDGSTGKVVLAAQSLTKSYRRPDGSVHQAVRGVSLELRASEVLGVLGESGSGKTTVALMAMGRLRPDSGTVTLLGEPWPGSADRRRVQLVQQDTLSAFDPRWTVERLVGEALGAPGRRAARRKRERISELLRLVGLGPELLGRRPRELSGGQRQRVAIARALAPEPEVLVCDEPVSALDVSVQAQVLDLLAEVRERTGVSVLFISHDLGVVRHTSDRVLVMKDGEVVEEGPVEQLFADPQHPYTRQLLAALPLAGGDGAPAFGKAPGVPGARALPDATGGTA